MINFRTLFLILGLVAAGHAFAGEPVDINSASAQVLADAIPGVGMKRAEAIVAYRDEHGPFASVDELVEVRGIGEQILESSRENLVAKPAAE